MIKFTPMIAAVALTVGASTAALAQSTGGSPADPNTNQNQQVGPSVANPTDPAAGQDPAARMPTAPKDQTGPASEGPASEGMSPGTSGVDSPAGIPADPNTDENQQMAPSNHNPADPAAGAEPGARVPTDKSAQ